MRGAVSPLPIIFMAWRLFNLSKFSHIPQGLTFGKSIFFARKVSLCFELLAGETTSSAVRSIKSGKFFRVISLMFLSLKENKIFSKILICNNQMQKFGRGKIN